jgi:single-stranded-DNA-specific exonuclease
MARSLEETNGKRRELQDRMVEEALAAVGDDPGPAIVVASDQWAPGVVGIVAAKLVDRFQRPAFVIAVDPATGVGRGSARSPGGVNLYRALGSCSQLLERFGGHAAAAGLTMKVDAGSVDRLREALGEAVVAEGSGEHRGLSASADAEVRLAEVDEQLADELGTLAPFGQDNPAPLLVGRGLLVRSSRRVGDGSHLKLELACPTTGTTRGAIAFGLGADDPGEAARVDVSFAPARSTWMGKVRVELEVKSLAPSVESR